MYRLLLGLAACLLLVLMVVLLPVCWRTGHPMTLLHRFLPKRLLIGERCLVLLLPLTLPLACCAPWLPRFLGRCMSPRRGWCWLLARFKGRL